MKFRCKNCHEICTVVVMLVRHFGCRTYTNVMKFWTSRCYESQVMDSYGLHLHEWVQSCKGIEIMKCIIMCISKGILCNNFTEKIMGGYLGSIYWKITEGCLLENGVDHKQYCKIKQRRGLTTVVGSLNTRLTLGALLYLLLSLVNCKRK